MASASMMVVSSAIHHSKFAIHNSTLQIAHGQAEADSSSLCHDIDSAAACSQWLASDSNVARLAINVGSISNSAARTFRRRLNPD